VNVIAKPRLKTFWLEHPPAQAPLTIWFKHMRRTRYENLNELRTRFPQADSVGPFTVFLLTRQHLAGCSRFNIGGNKYRLIVKIIYTSQRIYVDSILTHEQYDLWTEAMRKKQKDRN
jgi:mRNA interferase HigB